MREFSEFIIYKLGNKKYLVEKKNKLDIPKTFNDYKKNQNEISALGSYDPVYLVDEGNISPLENFENPTIEPPEYSNSPPPDYISPPPAYISHSLSGDSTSPSEGVIFAFSPSDEQRIENIKEFDTKTTFENFFNIFTNKKNKKEEMPLSTGTAGNSKEGMFILPSLPLSPETPTTNDYPTQN